MKKVSAEAGVVDVPLVVEAAVVASVADLAAVVALRAVAAVVVAPAEADGTVKSTRLWQSYCRILENIHVSKVFSE